MRPVAAVRNLRQVGDLTLLQSFLGAVAARCGGLFGMSEIARDIGAAINTVKAWLSVLEATYQVVVFRPCRANVGKRLVKTPKVCFADVGTPCHLAGLKDPEHAAAGPMGGAVFEAAVLSEIVGTLVHRGEEPRVHFWRTSAGSEVDIVLETGGGLVPVEVKLSATPRPGMAGGIRAFRRDLGKKAGPGYVVHPGDVSLPPGDGVTAIPFATL
jgi:predicted AAA+ superfamily ATPase